MDSHHGYMHHGHIHPGYMHHGYMHHGYMDICMLETFISDIYKSRGPKGLHLEVGARRAPRLLV